MTTTQTPDGAAGYPAGDQTTAGYPAGYQTGYQAEAGYQAPAGYPAQPMPVQPAQTLSILSLVAGIASILFGQTFIVPAAAIVLGFLARTREPAGHTMSTWGIVLGFVSLFGWVVFGLIALIIAGPFLLFGLF